MGFGLRTSVVEGVRKLQQYCGWPNTQLVYTYKKGILESYFLKLPIYREAAPCLQAVITIC